MTLTIVYDTDYESSAIYIGGILRTEFGEGEFDSKELMDCYESFAFGEPVKLERIEISSGKLGSTTTCSHWRIGRKHLRN